MNFDFFATDRAPAPLCFHAAHGGETFRAGITKTVTVRNLVETIFCGNGADFNGLEKNIVSGVVCRVGGQEASRWFNYGF